MHDDVTIKQIKTRLGRCDCTLKVIISIVYVIFRRGTQVVIGLAKPKSTQSDFYKIGEKL